MMYSKELPLFCPIDPAAAYLDWSLIAAETSEGDKLYAAIFTGSNQILME